MTPTYLDAYKAQQLRPCQLKQLEILKTVDSICRAHHIDYWLDGGTAVGRPQRVRAACRRLCRLWEPSARARQP